MKLSSQTCPDKAGKENHKLLDAHILIDVIYQELWSLGRKDPSQKDVKQCFDGFLGILIFVFNLFNG